MGRAGRKRGRAEAGGGGQGTAAGGSAAPEPAAGPGPGAGPGSGAGSGSGSDSGFGSGSESGFGSGSESGSRGSEGAGGGELVDAAFDFKGPEEADFHGVKAVLQGYLDGKPFDCSGLVDTVLKVGLGGLGCVIKVEGETIWESCLGVLSLLDTRALAGERCVREIGSWLQARADSAGLGAELRAAWGAEGVGLVVCERVLNLPLELAHPLQASLQNDLKQVGAKTSKFLVLSRVFVDKSKKGGGADGGGAGGGGGGKKKKRGAAVGGASGAGDLEFVRPEDEFFLARAKWSFRFPCAGKSLAGHTDLLPHRLAMLVDARGLQLALADLQAKYPPYWDAQQ